MISYFILDNNIMYYVLFSIGHFHLTIGNGDLYIMYR